MTKPLATLVVNFLRYRSLPWISSRILRLKMFAFSGIGREVNGDSAPSALLIFPTNSLAYFVRNQYQKGTRQKMHNIYFQGLAMLKCLVENGYVVDCIDTEAVDPLMDTTKYALIIDESNWLPFFKNIKGQKKVYFCTGLKWDRWNANEIERINWFEEEYKFYVRPVRQVAPNFTDKSADYILFKGEHNQLSDMNQDAQFFQLAMPVDFEPVQIEKDFSKREFIWVGGLGALHKGLDIVVDAFEKMPFYKLHIFGEFDKEPVVLKWLNSKIAKCSNIKFHGLADFASEKFHAVVRNCVAHVYPSAGENGCATLAQTAHFGVLPITTPTANNQSWCFGWTVATGSRKEMIESVTRKVNLAASLSDETVKEKSKAIIAFARKKFTREAFIQSFNCFLVEVKNASSYKIIGPAEKFSPFINIASASKTG